MAACADCLQGKGGQVARMGQGRTLRAAVLMRTWHAAALPRVQAPACMRLGRATAPGLPRRRNISTFTIAVDRQGQGGGEHGRRSGLAEGRGARLGCCPGVGNHSDNETRLLQAISTRIPPLNNPVTEAKRYARPCCAFGRQIRGIRCGVYTVCTTIYCGRGACLLGDLQRHGAQPQPQAETQEFQP